MAAEKSPAFQFYPMDFLTDERVSLMSHTERGIYITLLCKCWLEQSLPAAPEHLAKLVEVPIARFRRVWAGTLSQCFFAGPDGRLRQKRLEREREKQADYRRRQSHAGRASAASRLQPEPNHGSTTVQPARVQPQGNSSSLSSSSTKKQPTVVARPKAPPDPRVAEFLTWFQAEYLLRRAGAEYLVKWGKHGTLTKEMLKATSLEKLQKFAQIMLSEKCEDEFIVASDRGIEVLSAKFSWLSDRLAAWEARRRA